MNWELNRYLACVKQGIYENKNEVDPPLESLAAARTMVGPHGIAPVYNIT